MKLTRDRFIPCLDTSKGSGEANYVPIDKSTVFDFQYNPTTNTYAYICNRRDSNEVDSYAPTMEQEIVIDNSNSMFKFLYPMARSMPIGSDAIVPCLMISPDLTTGEPTVGELWEECVITFTSLNTQDGKLGFTLNFNGDKVDGTVSKVGTKITFSKTGGE